MYSAWPGCLEFTATCRFNEKKEVFLSEAGDKAPVNLVHSVDKVRANSREKESKV